MCGKLCDLLLFSFFASSEWIKWLSPRGDGNFLKARQEAKKGELDEQLREYINEWRKQRAKEEEELKRLKEKQAANTKKIIDERKSKGMKENKVKQKISIFIRNAILLFFVQHQVQHSSLHTMGKCNPLVRLFISEGRSWISSWKLTEHCWYDHSGTY